MKTMSERNQDFETIGGEWRHRPPDWDPYLWAPRLPGFSVPQGSGAVLGCGPSDCSGSKAENMEARTAGPQILDGFLH